MLLSVFKRILIFFLECLVLLAGIVVSSFLTYAVTWCLDLPAPFSLFLVGLALTAVLFFYIRKKTLRFKIEYEAARFLGARRSVIKRPRRAKLLRFRRLLLWFPSAWALFVLLFFPQATHLFHPRVDWRDYTVRLWVFLPKLHNLTHPGADHLIRNQVRIPWNWTILNTYDSPGKFSTVYILIDDRAPWPFGSKYRDGQRAYLSAVTINSLSPDEVIERRGAVQHWSEIEKADHVSREIHANGIDLSCSGYRSPWREDMWVIHCETPSPLRSFNLDAHFSGPAKTVPAFYRLMETARPAD